MPTIVQYMGTSCKVRVNSGVSTCTTENPLLARRSEKIKITLRQSGLLNQQHRTIYQIDRTRHQHDQARPAAETLIIHALQHAPRQRGAYYCSDNAQHGQPRRQIADHAKTQAAEIDDLHQMPQSLRSRLGSNGLMAAHARVDEKDIQHEA